MIKDFTAENPKRAKDKNNTVALYSWVYTYKGRRRGDFHTKKEVAQERVNKLREQGYEVETYVSYCAGFVF